MSRLCEDVQSRFHDLTGTRVLVLGLGRLGGGVEATRWLAGQGASVTVTDLASAAALQASLEALADLSITYRLEGHSMADLDRTDLVVLNPAVDKKRSEFFREILRRNIPWTTEMNLFCERCPARVVGVTGTYGKSTTCAMLAEVARACAAAGLGPYRRVYLGGNIGHSLLNELAGMEAADLVVLEMSDAQLEDLPRINWVPSVSVITNIHPNHLDRHGSWAGYVAAKLNILKDPKERSPVVVGELGSDVEQWMAEATGRLDERRVRVVQADPPLRLMIPGAHNRCNADCVMTVARVLGLPEGPGRQALETFKGLPHRLEHVRTLDGVDYINDSKSTSPLSLVTALRCFDRPLVVIVGGKDKGADLAAAAEALHASAHAVICTGENGRRFAAALREPTRKPTALQLEECDTLAEALDRARELARPGDAVLYSPGAPSFDAYGNFEERGRHFRTLTEAL